MISVYTDGSCRKNPGPGGWGIVITRDDNLITYFRGDEEYTTNNRMELQAILNTFEIIQKDIDNINNINWVPIFNLNEDIIIYSDSAYCVNAYNNWMHTWVKNNWKNSKKVEVENKDLMQNLYYYYNLNFQPFQVKKVKGHAGVWQNELADALAANNQKKINELISKYYHMPII